MHQTNLSQNNFIVADKFFKSFDFGLNARERENKSFWMMNQANNYTKNTNVYVKAAH